MKKLVSILLALVMTLALSVSAFAADTNVTIGTDANREYLGYQLLTLTTSLKADDACAVGAEHNKDCYNYAYSVNGDVYLAVLVAAINQADIDTADEVIAYIEGVASDSDAMNALAKAIYKEIVDARLAGTPIDGNDPTALAQGYWLFADVTDLKDTDEANSLVMVNTKGQIDLTVTPKVELPTITKEVLDLNDSTADAGVWGETADYDMGEDVSFKLTATLHKYLASYDEYKLIFSDTLASAFELNDDIVVTVYANADKDPNAALDIAGKYVTEAADDGKSFTVTFANLKNIEDISKDAVIEITYTAKLLKSQTIAVEGYTNTVALEFSNNPYDASSTGTLTDEVKVYTYKLVINKVDEEGAALKGAGFTLSKWNEERNQYVVVDDEIVGGDITTFTWYGLDDGQYKLEETTVPAGYNKMADMEFTISATHDMTGVTALVSNEMDKDLNTLTFSQTIENNTGSQLPETGAAGTMWLIFGGAVLVMLAGVFMITRKKMSVYED